MNVGGLNAQDWNLRVVSTKQILLHEALKARCVFCKLNASRKAEGQAKIAFYDKDVGSFFEVYDAIIRSLQRVCHLCMSPGHEKRNCWLMSQLYDACKSSPDGQRAYRAFRDAETMIKTESKIESQAEMKRQIAAGKQQAKEAQLERRIESD